MPVVRSGLLLGMLAVVVCVACSTDADGVSASRQAELVVGTTAVAPTTPPTSTTSVAPTSSEGGSTGSVPDTTDSVVAPTIPIPGQSRGGAVTTTTVGRGSSLDDLEAELDDALTRGDLCSAYESIVARGVDLRTPEDFVRVSELAAKAAASMTDHVPDELRSDWAAFVSTLDRVVRALGGSGGSLDDPQLRRLFADPRFLAAEDHIASWMDAHCDG